MLAERCGVGVVCSVVVAEGIEGMEVLMRYFVDVRIGSFGLFRDQGEMGLDHDGRGMGKVNQEAKAQHI